MVDAWQVIGFFGSSAKDDVPKVLTAAVLDPSGTRVVSSDIADSDADLRRGESTSLARFQECVALDQATLIEPFLWEPGAVLFLREGTLEYLSVWEVEFHMKRFVQARRLEALAALDQGDRGAALQAFDRARRVSNEHEDIEQVVALEPDERVRAVFARAPQ